MTDGVKVKWVDDDRDGWQGLAMATVGGVRLRAYCMYRGWDGVAFTDNTRRSGLRRRTRKEAKADAIRFGRELAEDALRAAIEMADAWRLEVDDE